MPFRRARPRGGHRRRAELRASLWQPLVAPPLIALTTPTASVPRNIEAMFSTCIFCTKPLGKNEALEAFPVGQRIAFDAKRGRLWVVCRSCERWNLSPFDERWEAVEQAERAYRDTRLRVATENIGLAKLRDGTTLVRIGEPLRPEFAAWRYGDQFGRRRNKALLATGGGLAAIGLITIGGAAAGLSIGGFGYMLVRSAANVVRGNPEAIVAKIRSDNQGVMEVRRRHLAESTIARAGDGSLELYLRFKNGSAYFTGREAQRIAAIVVPTVNRFGGNKKAVAQAVREIESLGGSQRFVEFLADMSGTYTKVLPRDTRPKWRRSERDFGKYGLFGLPAHQRLGLEMALHEESERRAMEGELAELERAWRDAEEIAGIADSLGLPESIDERLERLKDSNRLID
jgi:hypothetical protein